MLTYRVEITIKEHTNNIYTITKLNNDFLVEDNPWHYLGNVSDKSISSVQSQERNVSISPEELSRKWKIDINAAKSTLQATTQRSVRSMLNSTLNQRFSTN